MNYKCDICGTDLYHTYEIKCYDKYLNIFEQGYFCDNCIDIIIDNIYNFVNHRYYILKNRSFKCKYAIIHRFKDRYIQRLYLNLFFNMEYNRDIHTYSFKIRYENISKEYICNSEPQIKESIRVFILENISNIKLLP